MTDTETFAVLADLPLGAYTGRDAGGGVDLVPAPARLHAALVAAAAQGPRAVIDEGRLNPSPADRVALRWLEANPPDGVVIPQYRRFDAAVTAYRQLGLLRKDELRTIGKDSHRAVAVSGGFAWTWDEPPPPAVVDSLDGLLPDISHLGTSETPARLWVGEARPTHRRDPDADLFTTDVDLEVATPGRLELLERAHIEVTRRTPTIKDDGVKSSEDELAPGAVSGSRAAAHYVEVEADPVPDGPWDTVVCCELSGRVVAPTRYVAWAVAMHRALIATIGTGAPPTLTGAYADGQRRPANRVAIHLVTGLVAGMVGLDIDRTTVIVAIPRGVDPVSAAQVVAAVTSLRTLTRADQRRQVKSLGVWSGLRFWPQAAADGPRRWSTWPVAVPDTRPLRRRPWTLADAAALSVALVFRDSWPDATDRGDARYRRLADSAGAAGVEVLAASRVPDSRVGRWVHRVQDGVVVQPYRAELTLGTMTGDRALVAIGQSRHLGGGLLVPADLLSDAVTDAYGVDNAEPDEDDLADGDAEPGA